MADKRQIENFRKLGLSEAEIAEVLANDKRIDQGEKLFELTKEQEANSKKARQADRKKATEPVKRERQQNNKKIFLIAYLTQALEKYADKPIEVLNKEREIEFEYYGERFKIILSKPRKKT